MNTLIYFSLGFSFGVIPLWFILKIYYAADDVSRDIAKLEQTCASARLADKIEQMHITVQAYQSVINSMFDVTQEYINEMRPDRKRFKEINTDEEVAVLRPENT